MIRKLLHKIINRKVITCLLILVQIAWCVGLIYNTAIIFPLLNSFFYAVGIVVAIYIINRDGNPSYKIAWIIPILAAPLFGVLVYLLCANKKPSRYLRKRFEKTEELFTAVSRRKRVLLVLEDLQWAGRSGAVGEYCGIGRGACDRGKGDQ